MENQQKSDYLRDLREEDFFQNRDITKESWAFFMGIGIEVQAIIKKCKQEIYDLISADKETIDYDLLMDKALYKSGDMAIEFDKKTKGYKQERRQKDDAKFYGIIEEAVAEYLEEVKEKLDENICFIALCAEDCSLPVAADIEELFGDLELNTDEFFKDVYIAVYKRKNLYRYN